MTREIMASKKVWQVCSYSLYLYAGTLKPAIVSTRFRPPCFYCASLLIPVCFPWMAG